jgi:ABC-type multidrug transport system fused ATPase/permease subunit
MLELTPPKNTNRVTDVLAAATSLAEEKFAAIRTVRNFAQEMRESNAYAKRVDDVFSTARSVARINATFFSGIFFAVNMSMVLVLYHGATIVLDGAMTAGHLTFAGRAHSIRGFSLTDSDYFSIDPFYCMPYMSDLRSQE